MSSNRTIVRRSPRGTGHLRRRTGSANYEEASTSDSSYQTESDYETSTIHDKNLPKKRTICAVKRITHSKSKRRVGRQCPLVESWRSNLRSINNKRNTIYQVDASKSKSISSPSPMRARITMRKRSFSQLSDLNKDPVSTDEWSPVRKSSRISKYQDEKTYRRRSSSEIITEEVDPHFKDILVETIRKLRRKCDPYGFFSKPVDAEDDDCSDYYDVISPSEAMCFNIIEEKIHSGAVNSLIQIKEHIEKIIYCAKKYNTDEENFVRVQAGLMMSRAEPILEAATKKWNDRQKLKYEDGSDFKDASGKSTCVKRNTENQSRVRIRDRKQRITYTDLNSVGSEMMEINEKQKLKQENSVEESGPIEGSEIPFAKPMLVGSIMTPCNTRKEWKEICPKLAIVCNEAARRSTLRANPSALRYEKPLSETYIKERLDYDEPLDGFVIRTRDKAQHIQGFIVATCFKTWRKTFRFVFNEPEALITPLDHRLHMTDFDGSLTSDLQKCDIEEIDNGMGIRFPRICEISLLGALACGGALLSRTLSEIRQSGKYDYCVLQSTKIAIPFYEKHGFIRIGAVCKFNDMPGLNDVAYRHWSEIANGEAVEPSYMMARRLQNMQPDYTNQVGKIQTLISNSERLKEIRASLQSSHYLLSKSLESRVGSLTYILTYRELLSSAREFALSADDFNLVTIIDNAINQFTGSHIGPSKAFIKHELRNGVNIHEMDNEKEYVNDMVTAGENRLLRDFDAGNEDRVSPEKDIKVLIAPFHWSISDGLTAILPNHFLDGDDYFPVSLRLDNQIFQENNDQLCAKISRFLKSSKDMIEAGYLAVENLRSFIFSKGIVSSYVESGDVIMIRKEAQDGSFLWVEADVERSCTVNGEINFVVEWDHRNGKIKREKRVLTNRNRGIGKEWCTELDWASFFALPTPILDAWLIGSSAVYTNANGKTVEGMITGRRGGGMENVPTWRVEIGRSVKKKGRPPKISNHSSEYFGAMFLRNIIQVSDSNLSRVRALLKESHSKEEGSLQLDGRERSAKRSQNIKSYKKMAAVESWVQYRISKFNLADFHRLSEEEKLKIRQSVHKIDELIIHMRTGVQEDSKQKDQIPSHVTVPREKLNRKVKTLTNYMV